MRHAFATRETSEIRDAMTRVRQGLNGIAHGIVELGKVEAQEAREKLEEELGKEVETLKDMLKTGTRETQKLIGEARRQIEEHPVITMTAAFGIGLIAGKLLHKKSA
ncbi:MAG: DUF883 family protein [Deltaproteobacteria bacterium]|nr:DUF883 family protein [Deltaproteobacteria bacterium]